ncbi:uncharacterized protein CCR75_003103 [Bremia lactucae]|uniref:Uncharacterized protein n=1 Tax=Bremia lactucae TaxID=4779 RepID=A0A976NYQ8_BRELC|nr:hypothetical protein CCR75_003103 [Bremia lactucae]
MAGKSVFVKFCLNISSAAPHEGQIPDIKINTNTPFSAKIFPSQATFPSKNYRDLPDNSSA